MHCVHPHRVKPRCTRFVEDGHIHVELDLLGPVVLSVPTNIDDRYYSVAVMDAHMNTRPTSDRAGRATMRSTCSSCRRDGTVPDGMQLVRVSTPSICLYNRMLVRFEDGDLDRVRRWQAAAR